jgi:hypothetical protein
MTTAARFPVSVHALAFGKGADLDMLRLVSTASGLFHPVLRPRQHTHILERAYTGHGPGVGMRQAGWRSGFTTTLLCTIKSPSFLNPSGTHACGSASKRASTVHALQCKCALYSARSASEGVQV